MKWIQIGQWRDAMLNRSRSDVDAADRAVSGLALQPLSGPCVPNEAVAGAGIYFHAADDAGLCVGDQQQRLGERHLFRGRACRGADRFGRSGRIITNAQAGELIFLLRGGWNYFPGVCSIL